jgi:hypothetical protein
MPPEEVVRRSLETWNARNASSDPCSIRKRPVWVAT